MFSVKRNKEKITIRLANLLNLIEVMKFGILIAFTALKFEYSHVRTTLRKKYFWFGMGSDKLTIVHWIVMANMYWEMIGKKSLECERRIFQLLQHVSRTQLFLPIWILIILAYLIWRSRNDLKIILFHKLLWPLIVRINCSDYLIFLQIPSLQPWISKVFLDH